MNIDEHVVISLVNMSTELLLSKLIKSLVNMMVWSMVNMFVKSLVNMLA